MSSLNKVILIGNVGKDPEIRSMQSGDEIANFSIATSESWKDKSSGEKKEKTEWHRVSVFNQRLVKVIKSYVSKGSKVYIEGQLETRKWVDKDGVEKYSTEIVLRPYQGELVLLGSKGERQTHDDHDPETGEVHEPPQGGGFSDFDDEIPFARHLDFIGG